MRKYRSVNLRKMPQTCGVYGGIPWLESTYSYRVENRDEFEKLSKVVDIFIKNWMTTP